MAFRVSKDVCVCHCYQRPPGCRSAYLCFLLLNCRVEISVILDIVSCTVSHCLVKLPALPQSVFTSRSVSQVQPVTCAISQNSAPGRGMPRLYNSFPRVFSLRPLPDAICSANILCVNELRPQAPSFLFLPRSIFIFLIIHSSRCRLTLSLLKRVTDGRRSRLLSC